MAPQNKRLANLQRQAKRRAEMHIAQPQPNQLKASDRERDEMVRDHLDVLQNIEVIITAYAEKGDIDDRVVRRALEAAIVNGSFPDNSPEHGLLEVLRSTREFRGETSDDVWHRALRVVLTSVRNHSDCAPGEVEYLDFIRKYS